MNNFRHTITISSIVAGHHGLDDETIITLLEYIGDCTQENEESAKTEEQILNCFNERGKCKRCNSYCGASFIGPSIHYTKRLKIHIHSKKCKKLRGY